MTRYMIAIEGQEVTRSFDRTTILPGAIKMTEDTVPVTLGFDSTKLIGHASNMHRDDATGEITVDVELLDKYKVLIDDLGDNFSCSLTESFWLPVVDDHRTIRDCRLRDVAVLPPTEPRFWKRSYKE